MNLGDLFNYSEKIIILLLLSKKSISLSKLERIIKFIIIIIIMLLFNTALSKHEIGILL